MKETSQQIIGVIDNCQSQKPLAEKSRADVLKKPAGDTSGQKLGISAMG